MYSVKILVSIVSILLVPAVLIKADELSDAYQESTRLMNDGKYLEAIPFTKTAYEASLKKYGRLHKTTTTLALDLGTVTLLAGRFEEARPMLRRAVEVTETVYGTDAPNLVDPLIRLAQALATTNEEESKGKARRNMMEAKDLYQRALELAAVKLPRPQIAGIELEAAMAFARSPQGTIHGLEYAESALEALSSSRAVNADALARAHLWVGILRIRSEDYEGGQQTLENALALGGPEAISAQNQRALHVELIRLFESRGERDNATPHIMAVSALSSMEGGSLTQIAPLYWTNPDWRKHNRLLGEEQRVTVEFGISVEGIVLNPRIVQGVGASIDQLVLDSLATWRYALPSDDGVVRPVDRIRYEIIVPTRSEAKRLGTKISGIDPILGISDRAPIGFVDQSESSSMVNSD